MGNWWSAQSDLKTLSDKAYAELECATDRSWLARPELLDVMTIAITYMPNPGLFRACSKFTELCWSHTLYLEGGALPCPTLTWKPAYDRKLKGSDFPIPVCAENAPLVIQEEADKWWAYTLRQVSNLTKVELPTHCPNVTVIVLEDLPQLEGIRGDFSCCKALRSFTARRLTKLKQMCSLDDCPMLTHVVMEDLPCLEELGWSFLAGSGLEHFTLCDLPLVEKIHYNFLSDCKELKTASIRNMPKLKEIDCDWLNPCPVLTTIELHKLPVLTKLGHRWSWGRAEETRALRQVSFGNLNPDFDATAWAEQEFHVTPDGKYKLSTDGPEVEVIIE